MYKHAVQSVINNSHNMNYQSLSLKELNLNNYENTNQIKNDKLL